MPFRVDRLTGPPEMLSLSGDGRVIAARCYRADRLGARLAGLLFTPDLAPDEGLWLDPCSSVHSIALRTSIACVFVDANGTILRIVDPFARWRTAAVRGAQAVVELPAGRTDGLAEGVRPRERGSTSGGLRISMDALDVLVEMLVHRRV